jgi:hypothetical protein
MRRFVSATPFLPLVLAMALAACGGDDATPDGDGTAAAPAAPAGSDAAPAASGATAEADARALSNYRLNSQDLGRWAEVMRSPEQRAAVADGSDAGDDVSDLRELIEGNPEYRAAVERAGLTPTRFALISHVLIAAVSAHEAGKAGMDADSMASANGIHPANVGFVAEHEGEIRPLLEM